MRRSSVETLSPRSHCFSRRPRSLAKPSASFFIKDATRLSASSTARRGSSTNWALRLVHECGLDVAPARAVVANLTFRKKSCWSIVRVRTRGVLRLRGVGFSGCAFSLNYALIGGIVDGGRLAAREKRVRGLAASRGRGDVGLGSLLIAHQLRAIQV